MTERSRAFVRLAGLALAVFLGLAGGSGAASPGESQITLITGDRLHVAPLADGGYAIGIHPGPGRENVGFVRTSHRRGGAEEVTVMPADAARLVAAGRLDPQLFNVTALLRQGFDDRRTSTLPLIVTYTPQASAPAVGARTARPELGGARLVRALPSVNAAAVQQDKQSAAQLWSWVAGAPGASARAASLTAFDQGVAKVWLDFRARVTLDRSAPQVGAPQAWAAGLTGQGVTVAVLDTGIAPHPDLAGKVIDAMDFTETRPDASDDAGHGTHVAGTIAGTGAASGGRYKGIAPDATLLSGKVCDSFGNCPASAIIAGMEWAAPRARIVNMSLGGPPTDGTDPVSQALNTLAAQHGTLFVVAAGNSGLEQTVGSPGAADAALTVGSVTHQDAMSPFSSRGPRVVDYGLKPDITAPGSAIVAARAKGLPDADDDPVDDFYTRMSGTSMAAPHVAGAAAILAQAHPTWAGPLLKATLVSTSHPIAQATIYDQGVGRLDVARAVRQGVHASGTLGFGLVRWPPTQTPSARTVIYHNDTDAPVTLDLALAVTNGQGAPAPPGLFTLSAPQVTVPARDSAAVDVTIHPSVPAVGLFGGRLVATSGAITVRTAIGVFKEPESYDLTVRVVSRTGIGSEPRAQVVNTVTGEAFDLMRFGPDGSAVVRVPKGTYDVNAFDDAFAPSGTTPPFVLTLLSAPEVPVLADTTVVLDARGGLPLSATTDDPTAVRQFGEMGVLSAANDRGGAIAFFTRPFYSIFAVPTTRRVTGHTYIFFFRATLGASQPGREPADGARLYNLVFSEEGRIPARLQYRVRDRELAKVETTYHVQGAPTTGIRGDYGRLPHRAAGTGSFPFWNHSLPSRRTELFTATGVEWFHLLVTFSPGPEPGSETQISERSYRPGRYHVGWNRAPLGPAFGVASRGWGVIRDGNTIAAAVPLFSGSQPFQYIDSRTTGVSGTTSLSRGGQVLGTSEQPGIGAFPVPATPGVYTLATTARRLLPFSVIGTEVQATWTFRDPGAAATPKPLPLMVVRTSLAVDVNGRALAGRIHPLRLEVERQPGSTSTPTTHIGLEVSFDDGQTWRALPVAHLGSSGAALVRHPDADGFVSLRATARDMAGNTVTHTTLRAYQIAKTP